jgi:hypothetical protein
MVVGGSNSILIDVELLFGLFPLCETGLRLGLLGMLDSRESLCLHLLVARSDHDSLGNT